MFVSLQNYILVTHTDGSTFLCSYLTKYFAFMFSSAHDIWSHEIELLLLWWCILQTKSSWSGHCWWSRAIIRSVRFRFLIPLAWCAWHYGRTDLSLAVSFSILRVDQCLMQSWLSERGLHEEQSKKHARQRKFFMIHETEHVCIYGLIKPLPCHLLTSLFYRHIIRVE